MKSELMAEIGYSKTSVIHGIETWENNNGDKMIIDTESHTVLKMCLYNYGWLTKKELDVISKIV